MKNRYLIRAVKYFVWLVVLFVAILALMSLTKLSQVGFTESMHTLFATRKGWFLMAMIVLLSAAYPRFGYGSRLVKGDKAANRDKIVKAFTETGYRLENETPDEMVFRAESGLRRAMLLWEDPVRVTFDTKYIYLEGVKKEVAKIEYQLNAYLQAE